MGAITRRVLPFSLELSWLGLMVVVVAGVWFELRAAWQPFPGHFSGSFQVRFSGLFPAHSSRVIFQACSRRARLWIREYFL